MINLKKFIVMITLCTTLQAITLRDGCTQEGDPCTCPSLPEGCQYGLCFKGYQYGDESIYCQCHLGTMNDQEVAAFKAANGGRLPTDEACSYKPGYGYDAQGFKKLGTSLKKMADEGRFFYFKISFNVNTLKQAIDATVTKITRELEQLYDLNARPSTELIARYEDPKKPKNPCDYFKAQLRTALGISQDTLLSREANDEIDYTCSPSYQTRGNLDPCVCTNTKKPGLCQVNKCVRTGILRCHCD